MRPDDHYYQFDDGSFRSMRRGATKALHRRAYWAVRALLYLFNERRYAVILIVNDRKSGESHIMGSASRSEMLQTLQSHATRFKTWMTRQN